MYIFNKKAHFNKVLEVLFNSNMKIINTLNEVLTHYGAKAYIAKDADKFVAFTFMHILFLEECVLQKKYYPKYKYDVSDVMDTMIYEVASRCNYKGEALKKAYLTIRDILNNLSLDESNFNDVNLYYKFSISYVYSLFREEYKPEEHGFSVGEVYEAVAKLFQWVMADTLDFINRI